MVGGVEGKTHPSRLSSIADMSNARISSSMSVEINVVDSHSGVVDLSLSTNARFNLENVFWNKFMVFTSPSRLVMLLCIFDMVSAFMLYMMQSTN